MIAGEEFDALSVSRKITSWSEYQIHFGGYIPYGYLAYAVRGFFENGGDTCHVVRVAATEAAKVEDRPNEAIAAIPFGEATQAGTVKSIQDGWSIQIEGAASQIQALDWIELRTADGFRLSATVESITADGVLRLSRKIPKEVQGGAAVFLASTLGHFTARSAGSWGNRIRVRVVPLDGDNAAIRVSTEKRSIDAAPETEFYPRLNLADPDAANYAPAALEESSRLVRLAIGGTAPMNIPAFPAAFDLLLGGGRDGLSAVVESDFTGSLSAGQPASVKRGLRVLEEIEEIGIVCAPDAAFAGVPRWRPIAVSVPPCELKTEIALDPAAGDNTTEPPSFDENRTVRIYRSIIEHCERLRYRVAVLDVPDGIQPKDAAVWAERNQLRSRSCRFGALYFPWLHVPDELGVSGPRRRVPAAGHVAGIYARRDLVEGVQHPPANLEINYAADVTQRLTDEQQGPLNLESLNVIRNFPGRGIRVWGARSLAPAGDSDFRYIHVRRLLSAIQQTVDKSTMWTVFEPNDHDLRASLVHSLTVLLEGIWSRGGLKGETPEQGFYVKCDDTNNPQSLIDAGMLICQIGLAIAAPMEFIVFEIRRNTSGTEVAEG